MHKPIDKPQDSFDEAIFYMYAVFSLINSPFELCKPNVNMLKEATIQEFRDSSRRFNIKKSY
jgi:hypothetical protein